MNTANAFAWCKQTAFGLDADKRSSASSVSRPAAASQ
jgi:hypothetical protein